MSPQPRDGQGLDTRTHISLEVQVHQSPTVPAPAGPDTKPTYRVTFNAELCERYQLTVFPGTATITVPAPCFNTELAEEIRSHLEDVADFDGEVWADISQRIAEVRTLDGGVVGTATITVPAEPDYWLTLAADLHQAADRIATLAGTPGKPEHVALAISGGLLPRHADTKVVDAVAVAFGLVAEPTRESGRWEHQANTRIGDLNVTAYTRIPDPGESELARLRAKVAELEAQQAGGAR